MGSSVFCCCIFMRFNGVQHKIHGTLLLHTRQKRGAVMQPSFVVVVVVVSPTKLVVSRVEVMLVYQLPASLCSLRRSFLLVVRMSTKKKPSKVFSFPGTPQWTVPLKLFLKLLDMKMPCCRWKKLQFALIL